MVQAGTIVLYFLYISVMVYIIYNNYRKAQKLKSMSEGFLMAIHDIKNFSTNIDATGQVLNAAVKAKYDSIKPGNISKHIEVITSNCREMNKLIESFTKAIKQDESDEYGVDYENIIPLVHEAVKICEFYAKKNNILLEVETQWTEKWAKLDKGKFIRILSNLIMNGVKYSNEYGRVIVSVGGDDEWVMVSVKDSGKGMNDEELEKVFKKHYRGKDTVDAADISFGIGLYGSQQLARSMGGKIVAESIKDQGSIFTLILPLKGSLVRRICNIPISNKRVDKETSV
jgi:signal transduction histidine kinase